MPGTSGYLSGFRRACIICKRADAWKKSDIYIDRACPLFQGLDETVSVARYHSLCAVRENLPDCLKVIAWTKDQEIMGIAHKELPVYGVQFHPESVMTKDGAVMIKNFLKLAGLQHFAEQ